MALSFMGSAILVVGGLTACGGKKIPTEHNDEAMITRTVDSLELVSSENGVKKNMVVTPVMETHALAKDPFDEYRLGIETRGYDEETGLENFRVTADYALHFTHRELWDLKGNVSVVGQEGRQLFTQQLFWDEKLEKFYSNVDTRVTDGPSATVGTGFEADETLDRWSFRQIKGVVYVDTDPTEPAADSLSVRSDSLPVAPGAGSFPAASAAGSPPAATGAGLLPAGRNAGANSGAGGEPSPAATPSRTTAPTATPSRTAVQATTPAATQAAGGGPSAPAATPSRTATQAATPSPTTAPTAGGGLNGKPTPIPVSKRVPPAGLRDEKTIEK